MHKDHVQNGEKLFSAVALRCRRLKRFCARLAAPVVLAAAVLSLLPAPVSAGEEPGGGQTLVVGIPQGRCPLFYSDPKSGRPVGIGVDLMKAAADQAGFSGVSFRFIEEATLKDALDNGGYDLVMPFGSAVSSASGKPSIVSENLFQTPFTLVTQPDRFQEIPTLNKLKVGMLYSQAGVAETVRAAFSGIQITLYPNIAQSVKALRIGQVDALLHNSYVWSYVLQKPSYADLTIQPAAMISMDFRAASLESARARELIARLNEGIARVPDTRKQAIILDYTTRRLYRYDFGDYLYQYGIVIVLGVLLIAALIAIVLLRMRAAHLEQEERMRRLIDYDQLTGLLNVNGFRKQVARLLSEHPDAQYVLAYNNIRDFKFINQSLGRTAGDMLLKFWAARAVEKIGEDEAIGRLEADHFAILRRISGAEQIQNDEHNLFDPLRNFFVSQGKDNRVQICSGLYVLTPRDFKNIDVDLMLDKARAAERRVHKNLTVNYEFYNPEQWEKGRQISDIVNSLPSAIRSGEIQVWYQPQVDFKTGRITGAEALCRWKHSKLGWLSPAVFIPALEESGLVFDLDCFVWERVCQDLHRWNEQGMRRVVSVNVSREDINHDRDIPGHFRRLVETYAISPEQLHIEITESAYVERPELLINTTEQLRAYGFEVEMDDFGSGHSSLNMLKEVPVDRIKLDLHFLTSSGDPDKSRTIVHCVIQMMTQLGMKLIAEGVETIDQAKFLLSKGCAEMQGYYFHKPMPVEDFERLGEKA